MQVLTPATEDAVAAAITAAAAAREPLAIEGNGSKRALLRPVQAARTLSLRALSGITLYRPQELIISARAGTPLPEIEAALAEKGQMLAAEPPDTAPLFGAALPSTLGGIVGANLSGPRRISAGAMRDHVMGIRAVNGSGEIFRSGGRVLKNVTGLDLCKLLTGSHGTLGVLTEITLKVQPAPEASGSLVVQAADIASAVRACSAALGSPFGVSGAAILPGARAVLRIEDFADSVRYRLGRLRDVLTPFGVMEALEDGASRALWRDIRDAAPLGATADDAVWRISVPPSAAPAIVTALHTAFDAKLLLDWGGGLVWVAGPATPAAHSAVVAAAAGGSFTLFRAPEPLRAAVAVLPDEPAPLAALSARVKAVMDPAGILNPGRMRSGL